jgi:hypothetical protein
MFEQRDYRNNNNKSATACRHSLEAKYENMLDFEFRQQEKGELDLTTLAGAPSRKWSSQTQSARARSKHHTLNSRERHLGNGPLKPKVLELDAFARRDSQP